MPFLAGFAWGRPVILAEMPTEPRKNRGTCGAKTRKKTLCQAPPVWDKVADKATNGRCKLHGGMSTGASNRRRSKQELVISESAI